MTQLASRDPNPWIHYYHGEQAKSRGFVLVGIRMGVRFECPNGHKLNIKSFLAGKRGICPHCDAKFIIPLTSGGLAVAVEDDMELSIESSAASAVPTAPATLVAPPTAPRAQPPAKVEQAAPAEVWYVRPAQGDEQYGPATNEIIQSWIAEERIAPDSWVWKTGWDEWRLGSEVFTELNSIPAAPLPASASDSATTTPDLKSKVSTSSVPKKLTRKTPRSRRQQAQKVTVFLGALVLLLGIAVVLVISLQ